MIDFLIEHVDEAWIIFSSIVTIASIIIKLTPSQKDDVWLAKVLKFVEILSLAKRK